MDDRHELGRRGEARAAAFLISRGYRILERNIRAGGVELDLIARRGGTIVFVEVKTRRGHRSGTPHEAVGLQKRRRIVRGAAAWLGQRRELRHRVRFDVVSVLAIGDALHVRHFENAFDASADP